MKKNYLTIIALLLLIVSVTRNGFSQNTPSRLEPVLFKIAVEQYNEHKSALISALIGINGVTVVKHCPSELNRAYLVLRVNRLLQPDDTNILAAITSSGITSYKSLDAAQFQYVNQSCK